jgi:hypothetical protein
MANAVGGVKACPSTVIGKIVVLPSKDGVSIFLY